MHPTPQPRHPELVSGSIARFTRSQRLKPQPHRQIAPLRILGLDQIDLPLPPPVLELLLTLDRPLHVAEHLEMNEAMDTVTRGEAGKRFLPVLPQPLHQVRRDTDVQRAVA